MKGAIWKPVLIVAIALLCVYSVIPPDQKIRLGKDLRGGVSLVYAVSAPEDANSEQVISQVIEVLKQRVNPQGVLDITFQPQGANRMEVVMPLPSPKVRALQRVFQDELATLSRESAISRSRLEAALEGDQVVDLFGGTDANRRAQLATMQREFNTARTARTQLEAAQAEAEPDPAVIEELQNRIARSELRTDELVGTILGSRLSEARILSVLSLSGRPRVVRAADGTERTEPSEREVQLAELETEFPYLAKQLAQLSTTYADYEAVRTGLDDPEDLKRLLSGAGVLDFRIAVSPEAPRGVNPEDMREQLLARGARNTDSPVASWYPINDLDQWADTPEQMASLLSNAAGYFLPRGLVAAERDGTVYLLLYTTPDLAMTHGTGDRWSMRQAFRTIDRLGRDAVGFNLDVNGGRLMGQMTGPNVGEPMAILLDDQVYTAPNLNSMIADRGSITGNFSQSEIDYLVRVLAAGALEARLSPEPISTSILGPSIGADNLLKGLKSVLLAVIVVAILMVAYYFVAGLIADIALCMNALMIFGFMALIDGTFTLPGLAGIALTIGMAVDANVLVYERIREELVNHGETLRISVRQGYKKAASAILDGNITNLIVCFVLYQTAEAEVKGFALTLSLGVLGTIFTTLFVSRYIFDLLVEGLGAKRFPGLMLPVVVPVIHRLLQPRINWVALRTPFQVVSVLLAAAGLWLFFSSGKDILETEFRGGVSLTMSTRAAAPGETAAPDGNLLLPLSEVRERLRAVGDAAPADSPVSELRNATVLTSGETTANVEATAFQVKVANPPDTTDEDAIQGAIVQAVVQAFADQLDVITPVNFSGEGELQHASRTFALEKATIGECIGDAAVVEPVGDFRGGVAVLVEDVAPPITPEDFSERIKRLRNQPDYADSLGRQVDVVGITAAGASGDYSDFVVLVADEGLSSFDVDLEVWDSQLAKQEWLLVSGALTREASLEQVSSFSPTVAQNLIASAVVAVVLSLLGMLVYIWVRFGDIWYSMAAVMALCFNISVCLGAIAISVMVGSTGWAASLNIEEFRIDLNVIAGLLTIIGYSLNDTIVILDRIRENRGRLNYASKTCVNDSINQTFSRTVLTSGTTIVTALILFNLGGTGIRPFAFTFLVGLIAATYSSVAIAAPLVYRRGPSATPEGTAGEALPGADASALPSG
ncbi:MAG: protein translocase subunit SecD [Planctomycetota bacterium]|nr:protein translocase subunit SecD [Planctomycetota bacterium]